MEMGNGKRIDAQLCEIVCSACHEHFYNPKKSVIEIDTSNIFYNPKESVILLFLVTSDLKWKWKCKLKSKKNLLCA